MAEGKIFLLEGSGANLRGQVRCSSRRPRQQDKAAHHLIQTVYRAEVCVRIAEFRPDQLGQAARLICGQDAHRFYTDQYPVVLIENLHSCVSFSPEAA